MQRNCPNIFLHIHFQMHSNLTRFQFLLSILDMDFFFGNYKAVQRQTKWQTHRQTQPIDGWADGRTFWLAFGLFGQQAEPDKSYGSTKFSFVDVFIFFSCFQIQFLLLYFYKSEHILDRLNKKKYNQNRKIDLNEHSGLDAKQW